MTAEELEEFRTRLKDGAVDSAYIRRTRRSVLARLRPFERRGRQTALRLRVWRRFRASRPARLLGWNVGRRTLSRPGPVVAVVGADGAGKTRLTRDLEKWLGDLLTVRHVYFGQPKNAGLFRMYARAAGLARRVPVMRAFAPRVDAAKWMFLARRRAKLADRAFERVGDGEIVIAERYPLSQFFSMAVPMDGPRLKGHPRFGRRESSTYQSISTPDLVLALRTDLDTLRSRKLDLTVEEHRPKVDAVNELEAGHGILIIDVGRPYDEVLMEAKASIWKELCETR